MSIERKGFSYTPEDDILRLEDEAFQVCENFETRENQALLALNESLEEIVNKTGKKVLNPNITGVLIDEFAHDDTDESAREIIYELLGKLELNIEEKERFFKILFDEDRPLTDSEEQHLLEIAGKDEELLYFFFPENIFAKPASDLFEKEYEDFENEEEAV